MPLYRVLPLFLVSITLPFAASAASNTWTGSVNSNWDTATGNWTSPANWANGDDAVFGAGVGTVNIIANITAAGISAPGGSTVLTIGGGNTLQISTASSIPWSKMSGSGTLALNSATSYDWGQASLPAGFTGTLRLDKGRTHGDSSALGGATTLQIADGAQFLAYNATSGSYTYTPNLTLAGMGWGESGQQSGALRVSQMNATFTGNITLTGNTGVYTQASSGATLTLSGAISEDSAGRTLAINAYSNSITLNGAASNTFTGASTLDGGTVYLGKTGGAYAFSGPVNLGAGNTNQPNLRMQQANQFAPGVVLNFTNAASNWTRFDLLGTAQTLGGLSGSTGSGVVQNGGLGVGSATDATLTINGSGTTSFNGIMRNYDNVNSGGVLKLTKAGTGTQVMTGGNISYTGLTTLSGGVLSTDSLAANGSNSGIGAGTALTLDGGTLRYTGGNNGSDGGSKFNRTITVGASGGTLDATAGFVFFGGAFTGSGPLTFLSTSGTSKQWLITSSSGSYSGPVAIGNASAGSGFIQLRSSGADLLGTGTVTLNAGGILSADNGSTTPSTFANPLVLNGGRLGTQAPNMTYSGPVTLAASTNSLIGHYGNGSGTVNLSGVIGGTGSWSTVVDDGANHVTFSGTSANTFTGGSTVNRGTLVLSKSADTAAVGHLSISPGNASNNTLVYATANNQFASGSVLTFGGSFNYVARMELNGTTQTLAGLVDASGSGIVQNSEFGPSNSGMSTLVLNGSGSYTFASNSFAGLRNGSNGSIALTKNGTGTQTLSGGGITYGGPTAVNQGVLSLVNTTGFSSSAVANATTVRMYAGSNNGVALSGTKSGAGLWQVDGPGGGNEYENRVIFRGDGSAMTGSIQVVNNAKFWIDRGVNAIGDTVSVNIGPTAQFFLYAHSGSDVYGSFLVDETIGGLSGSGNVWSRQDGGSTGPRLTIGGGDATAVYSGNIGESNQTSGFRITKTGLGSQTFSGSNSYRGTTTVENGILIAQNGSAIGDFSTVDLANLATAQFQITHDEQVGGLNGGGALGGNISLAAGSQLTIGNNNTSTSYAGVISGSGASLQKRGSGNQTLSGSNTFSGAVTLQNGTLTVPSVAATGTPQGLGTGGSAVTFTGSGTLSITGSGTLDRGLVLANDSSDGITAGGTVTHTGTITGGNSATTFSKGGAGTFNQSGSGNWNGNFFITQGTYNVTSTGSIGSAGVIQLTGGSTFNIDTATQVRASSIQIDSGTVNLNAGTLRTNGITMASGTAFNWSAGTLTMQTDASGSAGVTDRRTPGSSASTQFVYEGRIIAVTGAAAALTMPANSVIDLGPTYGSAGMRYDQIQVAGLLDLSSANNTLHFEFNPFFFRPSSYGADAAGTLILVDSTGFTGTFENFTGVLSDYIGFSAAPGSGSVVGTLGMSALNPLTDIPANTYYLEYETDSGNVLFHYRLTATIPEPASAGLLVAGALLLRSLRRRHG